ncbi:MAG: YlmC/YmxH family sporulation protein [Clostridia bacterium]|nr:YlmC/YmxH family sporulation protein [Clostridia bacterium]
MRICCLNDFRNKEVINLCDGTRLGFVCDVEIDLDCGNVIAILVPGDGRLFSFGKCPPIRILWCDIERIGDDVILVRARRMIDDHHDRRDRDDRRDRK